MAQISDPEIVESLAARESRSVTLAEASESGERLANELVRLHGAATTARLLQVNFAGKLYGGRAVIYGSILTRTCTRKPLETIFLVHRDGCTTSP